MGTRAVRGRISVIIPAYNAERTLEACLRSVAGGQTYRDHEIILVNDGSTDRSGAIGESFAARDSRIRVVQSGHAGPAAARNAGLALASGEFVFFLDADDYLEPNALAALHEKAVATGAGLVVGDFQKVGAKEQATGHHGTIAGDRLFDQEDIVEYVKRYARTPYRYTLFVHCWAKLYRTAILEERRISFDPQLHNFEDVAFNFTYLESVRSVFFVGQTVYNYRVSQEPGSQSSRIGADMEHFRKYWRAFGQVERYLLRFGPGYDAKQLAGHLYISCVIITLLRTCGQWNFRNTRRIFCLVAAILEEPSVREKLPCYVPVDQESRIIPILIELKLRFLLILVCKIKRSRHRRLRYFNA